MGIFLPMQITGKCCPSLASIMGKLNHQLSMKDVVCFNAKVQNTLNHDFKVFCRFSHCLQSVFISTCSFIQLSFDPLNPVAGFDRRTENKIQGQKTCAIRPSGSQQLKTFDTFPAVMIKNPGQQFDDFQPGAIICAIINDKDFFSFIIC